MKRLLRATAAALPLLLAAGCATTNLTPIYRDPNYRASPVKRVFVVGIIPKDSVRVTFENATAAALIKQGFETSTAAGVFPPGRLDKEAVVQYVKEKSVDLVVVMRLTKKTEQRYVPPSVTYAPAPYYGGWYGAYGYGYGTVYSPGYVTEDTIVIAETKVFSPEGQDPIWVGDSDTFNMSSAQEAATSLAAALVAELSKAGILVK